MFRRNWLVVQTLIGFSNTLFGGSRNTSLLENTSKVHNKPPPTCIVLGTHEIFIIIPIKLHLDKNQLFLSRLTDIIYVHDSTLIKLPRSPPPSTGEVNVSCFFLAPCLPLKSLVEIFGNDYFFNHVQHTSHTSLTLHRHL